MNGMKNEIFGKIENLILLRLKIFLNKKIVQKRAKMHFQTIFF